MPCRCEPAKCGNLRCATYRAWRTEQREKFARLLDALNADHLAMLHAREEQDPARLGQRRNAGGPHG